MKTSEKRAKLPVYSVAFDCIGGKDVMPIGGWWGPFIARDDERRVVCDFVRDKYFKMIAEAGVNVITVTPNRYADYPVQTMECLSVSRKYGMGFFVHDSFFNDAANAEKFAGRAELFSGHENCLGFHLIDEPSAKRFDDLAVIYREYNRLGLKPLLYTNMLPVYGGGALFSGEKDGEMSYEQYLGEYLDKVKTPFLSYDYYPYYKAEGGNENFGQYFKNLSIAKKLCDEHEIPLWTFVQAGGQWDRENKPSVERYPSDGELLFDVNANLAYGVKSIQYFTLIQPLEFSHTDEGNDFRRVGIIGADGKKNQWYEPVRRANEHIAAIDHVLMNAACEGVIAKGETVRKNVGVDLWGTLTEEREGVRVHSDAYYELSGIDGDNLLVGCFNYGGKTALYAVNYDTKNANRALFRWKDEFGAEVYIKGQKSVREGRETAIDFDAGEGVLIVLL